MRGSCNGFMSKRRQWHVGQKTRMHCAGGGCGCVPGWPGWGARCLQALFGPTPEYRKGAVWQELKLKWYIQTHSQVALGEVLTFEWDEAYVDRRPYGTGESVRQLTGYEFEVEELNDESWNRLLFFKDGQLVKELIYSWFEWKFPVELLGFTPQTVFELQQDAPQYFFTVAEGYEDTAKWGEEAAAARQGESGAPPAQTPPAFGAA